MHESTSTYQKTLHATIQLRVLTSTCTAGDITEFKVSINGAQKGTLSTNRVRAGHLPELQEPITLS